MSQEQAQSLGSRLRQAREAKGKTFEDVQRDTGISSNILIDLEAGHCDSVEPIFGRMAVHTYAEYVGLDPTEAEKQFMALFGGGPPPSPRDRTQTVPAKKKHKGSAAGFSYVWIIVGVLILVGLIYWALEVGGADAAQEARFPNNDTERAWLVQDGVEAWDEGA
jgi:cytoskeletal protein RodZ